MAGLSHLFKAYLVPLECYPKPTGVSWELSFCGGQWTLNGGGVFHFSASEFFSFTVW